MKFGLFKTFRYTPNYRFDIFRFMVYSVKKFQNVHVWFYYKALSKGIQPQMMDE